MPMITSWAPMALARGSASFSDFRTDCSNSEKPKSANRRGATLISMLKRPSSVWNEGMAIAAKDLRVAQGRLAIHVHQIQLDLQARHWPLEVETGFDEHPSQHIQAAADLFPVTLTVLAAELCCVDLCSH